MASKGTHRIPYTDTEKEKLILRDHLAIDRTVLANERTILAYVRTALAFLIVGGTLLKLFNSLSMTISGWAFIAGGVLILGVGIYKFLEMRSKINRLE
jgi:putative membrane protein